MTVYGWDLSNHDWDRRTVDLADARKAGIALVTHKATEGDWYRDPFFPKFTKQLAAVEFPVAGSYHVLNHGIPVAKQTDAWIDYVNTAFPHWKTHPCWIWQIDAEPLDGYAAPTKAEIVACAERLVTRLKTPARRVVVYAPRWVYGDQLTGLPYRLWASNYADRGRAFKALYPGDEAGHWGAYSGQTPLILQYTSGATIGHQPQCDANAVRVADEKALQALFAAPRPAPKPTLADLLEEIVALDPNSAEYKRLMKDIAHAVWTVDDVPAPLDPKTGQVDPANPTWAPASYLRYLINLEKKAGS